MTEAEEIKEIADAFVVLAIANNRMLKFNCIVTLKDLEKAKGLLLLWHGIKSDNFKPLYQKAIELIDKEIKLESI